MPKKFSPELRERAVRMVYDRQAARAALAQHRSVPSRRSSVSAQRRCGSGAIATAPPSRSDRESRSRRRIAVSGGSSPRRDVRTRSEGRLSVFRSGTRPPHDEMIAFVDMHREKFGVEAICRILSATECGFITSRGYRAAKNRPASLAAFGTRCWRRRCSGFIRRTTASMGSGRCGTQCATQDGTSVATRSRG